MDGTTAPPQAPVVQPHGFNPSSSLSGQAEIPEAAKVTAVAAQRSPDANWDAL